MYFKQMAQRNLIKYKEWLKQGGHIKTPVFRPSDGISLLSKIKTYDENQ